MMWRNAPQNNIYPRLPRYKSRRYRHFQHWANLTYDIIEVMNTSKIRSNFCNFQNFGENYEELHLLQSILMPPYMFKYEIIKWFKIEISD